LANKADIKWSFQKDTFWEEKLARYFPTLSLFIKNFYTYFQAICLLKRVGPMSPTMWELGWNMHLTNPLRVELSSRGCLEMRYFGKGFTLSIVNHYFIPLWDKGKLWSLSSRGFICSKISHDFAPIRLNILSSSFTHT
jgi:hypothetical protein